VLATNRDLPAMLTAGGPGGDLFLEGGSLVQGIHLLRRPTPSHRFERGRGALWRLVSHLSVNHLSLAEGGLDALKELLRLYDLPRNAVNRRLLDGLVAIDFRRVSAWLPGEPFPAFVRGIEVRLSVDESHFVGAGLRLFAQVMDHFFGLYVHLNSFAQLKILSSRTQEELIACPPRSGLSPLL
jgi:type VI secretion system protein ImpG